MQKKLMYLCMMLCLVLAACQCKQVVKQEPPPPPPPPAPAPAPVEEKIVLNGIRFDFDKSVIKPEFVPVLEGYCDSIGTETYNMKLGMRRANSVQKYMVEKGVAADMLSTESFGESNPVADNATKEGRAMNRRVEFDIIRRR